MIGRLVSELFSHAWYLNYFLMHALRSTPISNDLQRVQIDDLYILAEILDC